MKYQRGVSLIELLVVIVILTITGSFALNAYRLIFSSNSTKDASLSYAYALNEAVLRARNMGYDSSWGVKVLPENIIVFSGTSYASRVTTNDRSYSIPRGISWNGLSEIVFSKFSATPSSTGTTTFYGFLSTSTVYISGKGVISY